MPAGTILFSDIVGFSKKPTARQTELVEAFTAQVKEELNLTHQLELNETGVLALPTGDGVLLTFMHRPNQAWSMETILSLLIRLQSWAFRGTNPSESLSLRFGVHLGSVDLVTDINGRANVSGDAVNFTQRVMNACNPRQVLFSETAFREYVGTENPCISNLASTGIDGQFLGPIELEAKHGLRVRVYKLILVPPQSYWCNADPMPPQNTSSGIPPGREAVLEGRIGNISESEVEITNVSTHSPIPESQSIKTNLGLRDITRSKVTIRNVTDGKDTSGKGA